MRRSVDGGKLCLGLRLTNQSSRAHHVNETRMSSVPKPSCLLLRSLHACDFAVVTQLGDESRSLSASRQIILRLPVVWEMPQVLPP